MRKLGSRLAAVCAVIACGIAQFSTLSPAAAAPRDIYLEKSPAAVAERVLLSSDPEATLASMSDEERTIFAEGWENQESVITAERTGAFTPTPVELAAMETSKPPKKLDDMAMAASGCWYYYYERRWTDFNIHTGTSWMQLNWCGSGGNITSWSQSNVGCAGFNGASCEKGSKAEQNVGWEIRSTRFYNASFFGYSNSFCMQVRGGATGLYSKRSSSSGDCSLS